MATWLKQSTAVDVGVGPFLDETDGKTAETTLTITQPDIRLKKNGGAWAQKNGAQTLSHEENGWYEVSLDSTDTDTLGILLLAIHESGALPVWREFMVVPANMYDSLVSGSDTLQADLTQVNGAAQTATLDTIKAETAAILVDTGTTLQGELDGIQADTEDIQSRLPAALTADGNIKADTLRIGGTLQTANDVGADVDAILVDTAEIGVAGAGLTAINLPDQTMNITGNITGNLSGSVGSVTGAVGSVTGLTASDVGAIKTQTDKLTFTVANRLDVNVLVVNGVTVGGSGTAGDPWGPA